MSVSFATRLIGISTLLLLIGCQSSPPGSSNVYIQNKSGDSGGCDARCQSLKIQYQEAAAGCRQGNQGECARESQLRAKMLSR